MEICGLKLGEVMFTLAWYFSNSYIIHFFEEIEEPHSVWPVFLVHIMDIMRYYLNTRWNCQSNNHLEMSSRNVPSFKEFTEMPFGNSQKCFYGIVKATFWKFPQKRSDNFSLFIVYSFLGMIIWSTVKRWNWLIYSIGHFQGRKGQVWPISS